MAMKPLPPQSVLRQLLRYDPESGELFWKPRDVSLFDDGAWNPAHRKAAIWNGKNAGKAALCYVGAQGYLTGRIFGEDFRTHRIVWKIVYGEDPQVIDHINGDRSDNRIGNLRSVTKRENSLNYRRSARGSGVIGVNWHSRIGKWQAKIGVWGKTHHLGYFSNIEDAASARREADRRFGFHENHGR